jgi:hypothetical protein
MLSSRPPAVQVAIDHFGLKIASVDAIEESYSSAVRILVLESGERVVLKIPAGSRSHRSDASALGPSDISPWRAILRASSVVTIRISMSSVGSRWALPGSMPVAK